MKLSLPTLGTLDGFRVGVTAARKAAEQIRQFERLGARVVWAPALSVSPSFVDEDLLKSATEEVLQSPLDFFIATTGIGMTTWFEKADLWGLGDQLTAAIRASEIMARGPKSLAALRRRGIREDWSPQEESVRAVVDHLLLRDVKGTRVVLQEHGESLAVVARGIEAQGARVLSVPIYRLAPAENPDPLLKLIAAVADRRIDALTFTSAPAVGAFMEMSASVGNRDVIIEALRRDVVAVCVGKIAADAFGTWEVPVVIPQRPRLAEMVKAATAALISPEKHFSNGAMMHLVDCPDH